MKIKTALYTSLMFLCLSCYQSLTHAWIEPVDMNTDIEVSGDAYNTSATYHRCDTGSENYGGFGEPAKPSICHRWGLVFEKHTDVTVWTPKVDGNDYRLPTIKELVRLFDYTGDYSAADAGTGLDDVIESWLGDISVTTWLVSSSYRDIDRNYDGSDPSEYAQVFALNASTGEVKTLQPGDFKICNSLKSGTGSGSNSSDDRGRCGSSTSGQTVHAIKVNRTLLKDL